MIHINGEKSEMQMSISDNCNGAKNRRVALLHHPALKAVMGIVNNGIKK